MIRVLFVLLLILSFVMPVNALEISAPEVPDSGRELMPDVTDSFTDGIKELLHNSVRRIYPHLSEASKVGASVVAVVLILSVLQSLNGSGKHVCEIAGTLLIASILLENTDGMIRLGAETVTELSEYGKLLLPVMTAGLAAQGAVTTSAALYTGTVAFDMILSSIVSGFLVPLTYIFLAVSAANNAATQDVLKKIRDFIKWMISWILKTILTVFTAYIGITGVVSGTTDAIALKATKLTISSVVPVVGGILSDASEAILVSAGIMKNSAGIYGVLAVLSICLSPFLKIGTHYIVLKATGALCSLFGPKFTTELIDDFSSAMGFLLAMTGSICLMLLISTVCFMRGTL